MSWPLITRGQSAVLLSETGTGKTLAAFLWALANQTPHFHTLYISPLKALAYDVEKNLRAPLADIERYAKAHDLPYLRPNRDSYRRHRLCDESSNRKDPAVHFDHDAGIAFSDAHIEVANDFSKLSTVIIDEIHSLLPTKRGAHLAVSIERLAALCGHDFQRIGVSATQSSLDSVTCFWAVRKPPWGARSRWWTRAMQTQNDTTPPSTPARW